MSHLQIDHENKRLLIIRFSSFGDIVQAAGVPSVFKNAYPTSTVDWLVRSDFAPLLTAHPNISKVISFNRVDGLAKLVSTAWELAGYNHYTHVYDAHNNLRSWIVRLVFRVRSSSKILVRPKHRLKRWLFFRFRARVFPQPFKGAESFLNPLERWGIKSESLRGRQFFPPMAFEKLNSTIRAGVSIMPSPVIALAASAAWPMKRWPPEHWKALIRELSGAHFVLLGGPEDTFLEELQKTAPERVLNLAGKLTLGESAAVLEKVDLVLANDTGILHVADQMERPTIALIGPTAFGYPSHKTSRVVEIQLPCKPCSKDGRGNCVNTLYQRCLVELTPQDVAKACREMLHEAKS